MSTVPATWQETWAAALDRLEEDVATVEALLAEEHQLRSLPPVDPWRPPAGLGPLPVDLRPRADQVLARQLAVAERIAAIMTGTARQAAMLGRIDDGRGAPRPNYVDCAM
ncbi:MAG TPA: hypothetical protein VFV67_26465 [Actinophytocola sp.]|uniref:hypothetical protein n=1 Tax=Actinophytocola sp. TaxID=1872138 RepID=UPI002DBFD37E|nr:hypothetical protein [Actinophytocola sp.]HEU5474206.1 hypothetical protein [Actinophytocola sp.]